jgi:hypothetical protein
VCGLCALCLSFPSPPSPPPRRPAASPVAARTAFDPCYHQECDDIYNVDMIEIARLARAVAHTLAHLVADGE